MILNIILLIIGFVFLIKGADFFVDGASSTARNLKISKMVIALTIVSFGTSAPEFAVSLKSIITGSDDMILGNVIGSNIINILLIVGIASIIHPISIKSRTVQKELPILLLITTLISVLISDSLFGNGTNYLTRGDGITILLFFTVFLYYLFSIMRSKKENDDDNAPFKMKKSILLTLIGLIGIVIGSNLVVDNATIIAEGLGVSQRMISLTIIALGTSLPELVTTVIAGIKKEYDIAVGNIIGSNIFNIGIVLGLPITLFGGITASGFSNIDVLMFISSSILLFILSIRNLKIDKYEGIVMLSLFVIYYSYVIFG